MQSTESTQLDWGLASAFIMLSTKITRLDWTGLELSLCEHLAGLVGFPPYKFCVGGTNFYQLDPIRKSKTAITGTAVLHGKQATELSNQLCIAAGVTNQHRIAAGLSNRMFVASSHLIIQLRIADNLGRRLWVAAKLVN